MERFSINSILTGVFKWQKNVVINGVTYQDVPEIDAPLAGENGVARFLDTTLGNGATELFFTTTPKETNTGPKAHFVEIKIDSQDVITLSSYYFAITTGTGE